MPDKRPDSQKKIDALFGMPLYYCAECLCAISVKAVPGYEPVIDRKNCSCPDGTQIMAPRKAIAVGVGGASLNTKRKIALMKLKAFLTQRSGIRG